MDASSFHQEEYKALKSEVMYYVKNTFDIMLFVLTASAGIYAWIFTKDNLGVIGYWALWIPLALSTFGALLSYSKDQFVMQYSIYFERLEEKFGAPGLGWEAFQKNRPASIGWAVIAFWILLIVINTVIPFLLSCSRLQ